MEIQQTTNSQSTRSAVTRAIDELKSRCVSLIGIILALISIGLGIFALGQAFGPPHARGGDVEECTC